MIRRLLVELTVPDIMAIVAVLMLVVWFWDDWTGGR